MKKLEGIFSFDKRKQGVVWIQPFDRAEGCYQFTDHRKFNIRPGARIGFSAQGNKVAKVFSICGISAEDYKGLNFNKRQAVINPDQRIDMGSSQYPALRILDMLIPVGMGSRGLIISPPRAGKTVLLEQLAIEIGKNEKVDKLLVLLIDERPEEVTAFKRNTSAIVYHSDMDSSTANHTRLAELILKNIELEIACGNNIVVLLDSLTRLSRASNLDDRRMGQRVMSGGLGTQALQLPRKLLGKARNLENGGSCTILATILRDTGSRMDEIIFQEFKGTGNCEIHLSRQLADKRMFPAIDIRASGTRKDELLHSTEELDKIMYIRRQLLRLDNDDGINKILQLIEKYDTNRSLLKACK